MPGSILIEQSFSRPTGFWGLLAPLFACVWWIVSVMIHEVGHGAMAQILGWRVVRLEAGSIGPFGMEGRVLGWRWKLVPYEFGGAAYVFPRKSSGYRWQSFLVYLAGPLSNVLLVWAGLASLGLAVTIAPVAQLAAYMLILTNLVLLFLSLRPNSIDLAGGEHFNDAVGMWTALVNRLGRPELAVFHGIGFEALARTETGDPAGATRLTNELLQSVPITVGRAEALDWAATIMMRIGGLDRSISLAREALAITPPEDSGTHRLANGLAYALLVRGTDQDIAESLVLARNVCNACPNSAAYTGTLGAALAFGGRLASGMDLLDQSSSRAPRPQDRSENECWKALAFLKACRVAEARSCFVSAERLDRHCFLLPRVRQALRHEVSTL